MKRILVFTTQLMETGGIESHLKEFCRQMSREVEIDLVVLNSAMQFENEQFFRKYCRKVFFGKNGRSFFRLFWLIRIAFICRNFKYDALYTNGQGNSIEIFASLLGKKIRWVHHHHTAGDTKDQSTWPIGYKRALQNATNIIACSKRNALDMERALNREVGTIPCFSRQVNIKTVLKANDDRVHFGYYGRLIPQKGIGHLCLLSEDKDIINAEFHIWGEGVAYPAAYFDSYKNLKYHGLFRGHHELEDVIGALDAFLLLSVHPEGLPICLLEAMSAGLPWLATDRGGIPDIVCDPVSTRIISSDASYLEIKNEVILLTEDIRQGKTSREKQKKLYLEKFSADALTNRWKCAFGLVTNME